jgi:Spy/CpxP family protein refolding chaperone
MKKYLSIMLVGVAMCSGAAYASMELKDTVDTRPLSVEQVSSEIEGKKNHFKKQRENFAKVLNLTEEQQKQAAEIRQKTKPQMEEIFSKMKELKKQADEIRNQNRKEFESLLTVEQKEKLETMKKERAGKKIMKRHKN